MAWHARKSASGSKRWMACPGSLPLEERMDPTLKRPTGAAAMTGTCAHALGEHLLRTGQRVVEDHWLGTVIWLDEHEDATIENDPVPSDVETRAQLEAHIGKDVKFFTRVDGKMQEGVQLYLDVVWEDYDAMGHGGTEMLVERRFDLDWLRPGLGGTSDCTLWQLFGLLRVIDYKNGYVTVEAEDNTQGMYYALGMAQEVDWQFEDVEVVIVQPNCNSGPKVKRFRLTRAELEAFRDRLAEAADRVDEAALALDACQDGVDFADWAGTFLDVGEDGDHCTFCDAFATCPAAKAKAEALAMADFSDDPPDFNPVEVHDDAGLERLAALCRWAPWLDKLTSAAMTLGQRRLEQKLPMPGFKLVEGKANRAWTLPPEDVAARVATELGIEPSECFEEPKDPPLKSPAQMEKLGAPRSKERKRAKELVAELAQKPPGKLKMAPESDPREEVIPTTAADDFVDDLPAEEES